MTVEQLKNVLGKLIENGHSDDTVVLVCEKCNTVKELDSSDLYANGIWDGKTSFSLYVSKIQL